jgi:uncharacterized protein YsxB (DUF464 family)
MIKVSYRRYFGYSKVEVEGHAAQDICAAVSFACLGFARQMEAIAKECPNELKFEFHNFNDEPQDEIPIKDRRRKSNRKPRPVTKKKKPVAKRRTR